MVRLEVVTFSSSIEARGWKAWKSIYLQASPGSFDNAPKAVLMRRICAALLSDDGFVWGSRNIRLVVRKARKIVKVTGS